MVLLPWNLLVSVFVNYPCSYRITSYSLPLQWLLPTPALGCLARRCGSGVLAGRPDPVETRQTSSGVGRVEFALLTFVLPWIIFAWNPQA